MPARVIPLPRPAPPQRLAGVTIITGGGTVIPFPRKPLRAVSQRRARENRQRAVMANRRWPDRRDGTVCSRPGCSRWAQDLHEPLSRGRGGGIVDPSNARPLCRTCHDELTFRPESELGWAYEAGLLRHSWDTDTGGGDAA